MEGPCFLCIEGTEIRAGYVYLVSASDAYFTTVRFNP
jgi:hypothetical protein